MIRGLLAHLKGRSQPATDPVPVPTARTHTCPDVDPQELLRALVAAGWTPPPSSTPLRRDAIDTVTDALSRARSAQDGR